MTLLRSFFPILFVLLSVLAEAQNITSFATDPDPFVKDLQSFMNVIKREDTRDISDQFAANYKAGKFPPEQMAAIIKTANLMLGQKLKAYPQFSDYLTAINSFVDSGLTVDFFVKWDDILDKVIQGQHRGSYKDFTAYMAFSKNLFGQNALYDATPRIWKSGNKDYELKYENQKPEMVYKALDLVGITANDSVVIHNTKGVFYPLEQRWQGQGGKLDWSRAGFGADSVYAEIDTYSIDMNKPDIHFDSVTFYHKALFNFPLKGSYSDKLSQQKGNGFPLFVSYRKDLKIDDLGPNVKYEGGFALAGNQILGTGDSTGKASLSFYSDAGKKVVQAYAKSILIRKKEELAASEAAVALYMGDDSIYHPGLTLKYKMDKKELSLFTGKEGVAATTFFDSYHKQEFKADEVTWNLNDSSINIKMIGSAGKDPVTFTSANFFQKGDLDKYQGAMDFNPISVIKMYSEKNMTRQVDADLLAKAMNPIYTENTIKRLLYKLVEDGFIYYDEDKGLVTVKDKVFNYVKANADKVDYDNIKILSFSPKTNGQINLKNNDIALQGVPMVVLSDSQDVRIFPGKEDSIVLKKNQDILFSNIVIAGNIDFKGKGFYFSYDSFKVDLTDLAAATINVPTGKRDKDGDAIYVPLKSTIEGLTGFLEIDKPDNKSGKKRNPGYPIYTNRAKSFVYYDKKEIADSAYTRDRFSFELEPFVIDSLKSFDAYQSHLKGSLVSADIFPTFPEELKIQPDLSMGFKRVTPAEGYDIYKGKGHYNDSIWLSNAGLRGKGRVTYLFTYFQSDSILFTPDTLNAVSDSFHMDKTSRDNHTYPMVIGKDNNIHWIPYGDSMYIHGNTVPFVMYEEGTSLKGNLLLTDDGLQGDGSFEFKEAAMSSDHFNFQSESLDADTMSMQIKSLDNKSVTFKTPNVKGRVDFAKRVGEFNTNEKDIPTVFSNNFYKTEINHFYWDIDSNILDFKAPEGSEGADFVSTKQGQDSLRFLGKRGVFNMTTSIIKVTGVPEIRVADASIIPDSGKVVILPGGLLDTLTNAVVVVDTAHMSRKLYNATIAINSRKDYTGNGYYDYTFGDKKESIHFLNIAVKQEGERRKATSSTVATTSVDVLDTFRLNNGIKYKGDITLDAKQDLLQFKGFGKLDLPGAKPDSSAWFALSESINPDSVVVHYNNPLSEDKDTLFTGIAYAVLDSISFYPCLMRKLENPNDVKTFTASGIVKYDDAKKTYVFGDENKINTGAASGNMLTYDLQKREIIAEGSFNMGVDFDPITLVTSGNIVETLDSSKFVFNTFIAMKIPVDKSLMTQFASDVNSFSFANPASDYSTHQFQVALANTISAKKAAGVLEEISKNGQFNKPKELGDMNLIISNAKMLYDPNYQIFRSQGTVSVSFIGESGVHKQLTGYVEFGLRKGSDFFNIYFESKTDDWYYVSYNNSTLQMLSSKEDFNKMIAAIPPDKRKIKLGADAFYFYTIGTHNNEQSFLKRMHNIEMGIKVDMSAPTEDEQMATELDSLKKELLSESAQDSIRDSKADSAGVVAPTKKGKKNRKAATDDMTQDASPLAGQDTVSGGGNAVPPEVQNYNKKKKKKKSSDDLALPDDNQESNVPAPKPNQAAPAAADTAQNVSTHVESIPAAIPPKDTSTPANNVHVESIPVAIPPKDTTPATSNTQVQSIPVSLPPKDTTPATSNTQVQTIPVTLPPKDTSTPANNVHVESVPVAMPPKDTAAGSNTPTQSIPVSLPPKDTAATNNTHVQTIPAVTPPKDTATPANNVHVETIPVTMPPKDTAAGSNTPAQSIPVSLPPKDTAAINSTPVQTNPVTIPPKDTMKPNVPVVPQDTVKPKENIPAPKDTVKPNNPTPPAPTPAPQDTTKPGGNVPNPTPSDTTKPEGNNLPPTPPDTTSPGGGAPHQQMQEENLLNNNGATVPGNNGIEPTTKESGKEDNDSNP